jgi:antitoxin component YwqK of YwqJK toxin-antitoxin module
VKARRALGGLAWLLLAWLASPLRAEDEAPRCDPIGLAGQQRCQMPDGSTALRAMSADGRRAMVLLRRWADGSLAELRCAPVSLLPEDREPCGHGGESAEVTLFREPGQALGTVSHRRGVLMRLVIVNPQGGVVRSEEFIDNALAPDRRIKRVYYPSGRLRHEIDLVEPPPERYQGREGVGREFAESGQITQEVEWAAGRERRIRQWYLNGQLKLEQTIRRLGRDELRETRSFYEDGTRAALNRERNGRLFGWQQYHAPGGALQREEEHGERGLLLRRKRYDAQGGVLSDERVNEDPSRS